MNISRYTVTALVSMAAGIAIGQTFVPPAGAQTAGAGQPAPGLRPAYMVVSSRPIAPDKMGPYRQAAGPLATNAGMQVLAAGNPAAHLLEGKWPYSGNLTIERYRSMDDLLAFWNSPAYQDAKKLREGLSEIHFIVAIEGR